MGIILYNSLRSHTVDLKTTYLQQLLLFIKNNEINAHYKIKKYCFVKYCAN